MSFEIMFYFSVRHVLSNGGGDCTELLQLIDEQSRLTEKLMEEAKGEKEDLQQQVNCNFFL